MDFHGVCIDINFYQFLVGCGTNSVLLDGILPYGKPFVFFSEVFEDPRNRGNTWVG